MVKSATLGRGPGQGRHVANEGQPRLVGVLPDDEQAARPAAEQQVVGVGEGRHVAFADGDDLRGHAPLSRNAPISSP